jgi:hypothetical protein
VQRMKLPFMYSFLSKHKDHFNCQWRHRETDSLEKGNTICTVFPHHTTPHHTTPQRTPSVNFIVTYSSTWWEGSELLKDEFGGVCQSTVLQSSKQIQEVVSEYRMLRIGSTTLPVASGGGGYVARRIGF